MLRNRTGSNAEFVKERNWGDFNRQVWRVVVNIQNTSALLQRARWDTLFLSHPHPSEPKDVYQYLDALEVGRFELHVPVSGDLKEKKKQGVKHHNSELSSCSYSTEKGTQWPSRHPEGWELLERDCLPKPHSRFRRGLCSWGCRRTSAPTTELTLNWHSLLGFKVSSSKVKDTALPSASQICKATSSDIPSETCPLLQGWRGGGKVSEETAHTKWEKDLLPLQRNTGEEGRSRREKHRAPASAQPSHEVGNSASSSEP